MSKARQLADNGAATPNRNMVINGAMNVAQRGTSSTGLGASNGYFTLDRWKLEFDSTAGRLTMTQTADGPSGFLNCLKLACTTADTSIAAGEIFTLQQRFEGQNLQRIKKGTSDAEKLSVSFYVKGNASATYVCELRDQDNERHVAKTFAVTTSWNRIELVFPADTSGAFGDDNARSLDLNIWLHAGSTYTGGTAPTTWSAFVNNTYNGGSTINMASSTSNEWLITGIQLEVGEYTSSTIPPFQLETYGDNLLRCQRYYTKVTRGVADTSICNGRWYNSSNTGGMFHLPTSMRSNPTLDITTGTNYYNASGTNANNYFDDFSFNDAAPLSLGWYKGSISGTQGDGIIFMTGNSSASVSFDSEL